MLKNVIYRMLVYIAFISIFCKLFLSMMKINELEFLSSDNIKHRNWLRLFELKFLIHLIKKVFKLLVFERH